MQVDTNRMFRDDITKYSIACNTNIMCITGYIIFNYR